MTTAGVATAGVATAAPRTVVRLARVGLAPPPAAAEQALLSPRATEKKKQEFAAGRHAAHRALTALLGPGPWVVGRTAAGPHLGAPVVTDAQGAPVPVHLSISHHDGWAVAAASHTPVGVDLNAQASSPQTSNTQPSAAFVQDAFQDEELSAWRRALPACDDSDVVALAFAAKEAASKVLRVGFGLPLLGFAVTPDGPLARGRGRVVVVVSATDAEVAAPKLPLRLRLRWRRLGALWLVLLHDHGES